MRGVVEPEPSKVTGRPTSAGFGEIDERAVGGTAAVKVRAGAVVVRPARSIARTCHLWPPVTSAVGAVALQVAAGTVAGRRGATAPSISDVVAVDTGAGAVGGGCHVKAGCTGVAPPAGLVSPGAGGALRSTVKRSSRLGRAVRAVRHHEPGSVLALVEAVYVCGEEQGPRTGRRVVELVNACSR